MFTHIHFSPVCEFLVIVHTAKTGLLRCCLYKFQLMNLAPAFFASLALAFVLDVLALALALALRICSGLHWRWSTVDVMLCSRDLENLLSHLIPACDSDAVPDEVLFDSHVLHSQHRHSYLDIVVNGIS